MTIRTLIKALKSLFKAGILRDTRVQILVNQRKLTLSKNHRTLVGALQLKAHLCLSDVAISLSGILDNRYYIRGGEDYSRRYVTLPLAAEKTLRDIFTVVEYCQKPLTTKPVKVSKQVADAIRLMLSPNSFYKAYHLPSDLLEKLPSLDREALRHVVLYDGKKYGVRIGTIGTAAYPSELVDFKDCGGSMAYCIRSSEPDRVLVLPYTPDTTPLFNAIVEVAGVL